MYKITRLSLLVILITAMLLLPTAHASAAMRGCRADPIFKLSNGDFLMVTLEIGTVAENVKNIHYVLHVPSSVSVLKVTYPGGDQVAMKETYVVYQDSGSANYLVDTLVTTQNAESAPVTVFLRLSGGLKASFSGLNNETLTTTFGMP